MQNPQATARATGILILLTIVGGVFAQGFVSNRLVQFSDAGVTAANILANRSLFQVSFTVLLIEMACQIATTALFYRLLRPVNGDLALVSSFIDLAGSVMKTMARVFYITPLLLLSGATAFAAFTPEQLRALALLLLRINDRGAAMALAFFGVSGVLRGYLIYRSGYLPRFLGIAAMISGAGWLRYFYTPLRFPPFTFIAVFALAVAAIEIFWLIFRGVDRERWNERTGS
jgi:hypothetical protein